MVVREWGAVTSSNLDFGENNRIYTKPEGETKPESYGIVIVILCKIYGMNGGELMVDEG